MNVEPSEGQRPFAYADPRSVSRAWFDALYARAGQPQAVHAAGRARSATTEPVCAAVNHSRATTTENEREIPSARAGESQRTTERTAGVVDPLNAARERTARMPVVARPAAPKPEPLDVVFRTSDGIALRVLLEHDAGRVRAVAVCDVSATERVADALVRARAALGACGIQLQTRLLEHRGRP